MTKSLDAPWVDDLEQAIRQESHYSDMSKQLAKRKNDLTPDFQELKLRGDNLVFVYGTLRPKGMNSHLLEGDKYLGRGRTLTDKYILRDIRGKFPIVKDSTGSLRGKIEGDVFAVDALTMMELDYLEGNGTLYTRKERWIRLQDQHYGLKEGKSGTPVVKCWIYLISEQDKSFDNHWLGNSITTDDSKGEKFRTYRWGTPDYSLFQGLETMS